MAASLTGTLARAVVDAMTQAGLDQNDFLTGPIVVTNAQWQVPPLDMEMPLLGIPLNQYFERPIFVRAEALHNLWSDALLNMRNAPTRVLTLEGFRALSYALPKASAPERNLLLSMPEGFPGPISDLAGVLLSIEVAHLLRQSVPTKELVSDPDNFYVVLEDDREVGVKNGLPTFAEDEWDCSAEGMVTEMLTLGRGAISEECEYDIIAKVRSMLLSAPVGKFRDHEALEWALQALRVLHGAPALLRAIQSVKSRKFTRQLRLARVREAHEVAHRFSISDRARVITMRGILVPEVMPPGRFSKLFYPYSIEPPALLAPKVLSRIRSSIDQLLSEEEAQNADSNAIAS